MSDLSTSDHAAAASILEALAEPDDHTPVETANDAVDTDDSTEQVGTNAQVEGADDTATEDEQQTPAAIDPPNSWKAEAKDQFRKLPPDLQTYLSQRESERDKGLSEAQRKAAESSKAIEAERESVAAERKAYAERLLAFVDMAKANPKLAEWQKRDWVQYLRENPLEGPAEQLEYANTIRSITQAQEEAKRAEQQNITEQRKRASAVLSEKLDFWGDETKRKAFQSELRTYLKSSEGLSDEELDNLNDPRVILVSRKAMLYDKLMAEQAKIAAKKPVPPGKTLKPQASTTSANPQADRLAARAAKTGRLDDQAAAILARI